MEAVNSLHCSKQPNTCLCFQPKQPTTCLCFQPKQLTTCLCFEPKQTSPHPPSYFFKIKFNIVFPSRPRSSKLSLYLRPPLNTLNLYACLFSPLRSTCPGQLILLDLITRMVSGEEYKSLSSSYSISSSLKYVVG